VSNAAPPAAPNAAPAAKQQLLWQKLEAEVAQTDRGLDGVVGVAITDLTSGQQLLHNADQVFPTASVIKLAVLAELYRQEQQALAASSNKNGAAGAAGKARLGDLYTLRKEDLVPDSDILGGLTPGVSRVTNRDLATMMVAVSDNSAANILIECVGMENVNALLDSLGLKQTRLRRKMMDLEAAKQGRENVATPRELAALLEAVYSGKVVQKPLADDFFKMLASGRTHYKAYFRAGGIPDDVVIAEKEGELEGVRADCGVVFVPGRPFVLCVMTSYLTDERAGEAAISRIAGAAWRTFDRLGRASPYGRIISPRNSAPPK
jgi:beta-lactamase class A